MTLLNHLACENDPGLTEFIRKSSFSLEQPAVGALLDSLTE
jgi:hypothetical protein